ncbi:DUF305 domain-containing protein [Actinoplanes sp. KI2]|uniref:DUF305 domain-containing protein n=1 Tax=Actinoplanes sp. KI2 TaxID=2983315 RepID=UPI0021D578E4|nr:DUF305 domain-containing protein [Actinoplanes sp. KI2]MCU7729281.1 DUF305 domain-containing protein [Actinoplanes sp. KI2]
MRRVSKLLAVLLLLGGCGSPAPAPATSAIATSGAGNRHTSADVRFAQALIPHHREGIALASAVARQPAARTLAEAIIVTEQDEVVRMTGWLREWSADLPAASSPAASSLATPSSAAGNPVRALIAHQEEAIRLAQQEQAGGANPAALAFAKQIVESRTEEIAQLRTYLG